MTVSNEVAIEEFERMCATRKIQTDESKLHADHLEEFQGMRNDLIEAIEDGVLTVDAEGVATFNSEDGKDFTFHSLTGGDMIRMDKYKANEDMHKVQATAAALCRCQPKQLSVLGVDDWQFILKVAGFFMGSKKQRSSRQK